MLIKWATATVVVIAAGVYAAISILTASAVGAPTRTATAGHARAIGALFTVSSSGALENHFCTASVVDSPAGDLVLTAAHCLNARSRGAVAFVPDYVRGQAPFGIWMVTRVVVDQAWSSSADPDDDFAFLVVSQRGTKIGIQQVTGGETIGIGTPGGGTVRVAGYPDGQDSLISCDNTALVYSPTQLQFDCGGFTDGTSGSPLLADVSASGDSGTVIGVIGGYQQGGDTPSVSYAARFSTAMAALYKTAIAGSSP